MPIQDDYRVSLDTFQGPLDLLLFLIRRAEVDIHDIPVAQIAEQYLAFLKNVDEIDVDLAGEFLVMASTLIELKSRTLMPPEDDAGSTDREGGRREKDAEEDPRYALVQQLLAYQRFRIASEALDARREAFSNQYHLRPGRTDWKDGEEEPVELDLEDAHPLDLAEAYERIMSSIDFSRLGDHKVEIDDTPIKLHEEDLLDRLSRTGTGRIALQDTFAGRTGGQRVGLFLATLELARQRRVTIEQPEIDAEIMICLRDEDDLTLHIEYDDLDHEASDDDEHAVQPGSGPDHAGGGAVGD